MKILEQVESILRYVPRARNSDRELFIIYMQKSGMSLTPAQERKFRDMPSLETVRRSRQLLQERGLYPADKAVDEQRHEKFRQMTDNPITLLNEDTSWMPSLQD